MTVLDEQPPPIAAVASQQHHRDRVTLQQALETGLSGTASVVSDYEAAVGDVYRSSHCIAVSSGSMAVAAVLDGLGCERGQEIVVSPAVPICTVLPMLERGLTPVFCDVRPDNFGLSPEDLERAVSPRTAAVFEVPMWGYPAPVDETQRQVAALGLPLVADLAQCHFTELHGQPLASYADVACFSTHESKFLSTGEGGFVLSEDAALSERIRDVTRFGNLMGLTVGLNMKLGALQAAIGLARVADGTARRDQRLANRGRLLAQVANPRIRELSVIADGRPDGFALLFQTVDSDGRTLVAHQIAAGVPSDVHTYDNKPLYELPLLAPYWRSCPNAAALLRSLTTIPIHEELSEADVDYIAGVLNAF
jgi:dTDP-4-amino-4,6-dideoxygalactose transaminase